MPDLFGTQELEVKIKVITIDGKKMAKSLFFQLMEKSIITGEENTDKTQYKLSIIGRPLGFILINDCKILLWQEGDNLRRCNFPFRENFSKECINLGCTDAIYKAPHLFLGS